MLVYIAGPLTHGDQCLNVRAAVMAGNRLMRAGHDVIIPHLFVYVEMMDPVSDERTTSYDEWLARDLRLLKRCDCVLRLPGTSPGADREVTYAREHGIPVYFDEHELRRVSRPIIGDPACKHDGDTTIWGGWPKCAKCGAWKD